MTVSKLKKFFGQKPKAKAEDTADGASEGFNVTDLRDVGNVEVKTFPHHGFGYSYARMIADLIVEGRVIVEVKSVERIIKAHIAQTLNYLNATRLKLGLVLNFNRHTVDVERLVL